MSNFGGVAVAFFGVNGELRICNVVFPLGYLGCEEAPVNLYHLLPLPHPSRTMMHKCGMTAHLRLFHDDFHPRWLCLSILVFINKLL